MSFITDGGDVKINIIGDLDNLNRAMDDARDSVEQRFGAISRTAGIAMTAVGGAIVGSLGLAVNAAAKFGTAMAEVNTLGVQDLDALSESVQDVSAKFGLDLVDGAKAAYQAISAGASEAQTPQLLAAAAQAATAGVSDLTTAIDLGTSVTNAYGGSIENVNGIYDQAFVTVKLGVTTFSELASSIGQVSPIMAAAKLSSEEMFAAIAALTKGGLATTQSVTGLKAAISNVIKPTSDAQKTAEALGLQFDSAALSSQGLAGFMDSVRQAAGGNVEIMSKLFGSVEGLNIVLALTGEQATSFNTILGEMKTSTGATQEAFDRLVATDPAFAWRQMRAEIQVLAVQVGQALLPALNDLLQILKPIVSAMVDWIQVHPEATKWIVTLTGAAGALMVVLGPMLIMLPGLTAAWTALAGAGPLVSAAFAAITTSGVGAIAALAGPAGLASAFVFATYEIMAAINAIREYNAAQEDLAQRNQAWAEENEIIIDGLRRHGVAVEELGIKHLDVTTQQQALGAVLEELRMREAQGYDIVGQAAQDAYQRAAQASVQSAGEQQQAWTGVLGVLESILSLPLDLLRWINGSGGMQSAERGGVIGVPGYETGGCVGVDMQPFRWNEKDGEIAVAPVGTRILPHDQAVTVARDAIAQAMSGGMGGGPTININNPVVRNESDLRRIADYVTTALDSSLRTASGRGGVINAYG